MAIRPKAALAMYEDLPDRLFARAQRRRLAAMVDVCPGALTEFDSAASRAALADVEVLITGWGVPPITGEVLDAAPRLRAVLHAAGSVKAFLDEEVWRRDILVSTAAEANARPVAEYTVAMILLSGKAAFATSTAYRRRRSRVDLLREYPNIGNYRRAVGVVGASRVGRRVIELLAPFDFDVAVYDPYLDAATATRLGVTRCGLNDLMTRSDVVTVHAPQIPETHELIGARQLALLRDGAVLINTARGSVIDQDALVAEVAGGRIEAIIDTTEPDVLPRDHPLYTAEHVLLTPHLAGAQGNELHRLAALVLDELTHYLHEQPLLHPVTLDDLPHIA